MTFLANGLFNISGVVVEYIVGCFDQGDLESGTQRKVIAATEREAELLYRKHFLANDETFRDWVLDKACNAGVASRFWIWNQEEDDHFNRTGELLATENQYRERALHFFADNRRLGLAYLNYYFANDDDEEYQDLPQEVYEYIAMKDTGFVEVVVEDFRAATHAWKTCR